MKHVTYRFYDKDARLVYVGVTDNVRVRWGHHRRTKAWWSEVEFAVVQRHPSRAAALADEADAIRVERPRYNLAGNGQARQERLPVNPYRVEVIPLKVTA